MYSEILNILNKIMYERFVKNSMTDDNDTAGNELHLTGGLVKSMLMLDEYLKFSWLDSRTRYLHIEFQIYTPHLDSITLVKICVTTNYGLLYTISKTGVSMISNMTPHYLL